MVYFVMVVRTRAEGVTVFQFAVWCRGLKLVRGSRVEGQDLKITLGYCKIFEAQGPGACRTFFGMYV